MPHISAYNPELGIIETKYSGIVTFKEIIEFSSEIILNAKEIDCYLTLGDYSEAEVEITTLEIYRMPKIIAEQVVPLGVHPHKFKRAFVIAEHMKDFYFGEDDDILNAAKNELIMKNFNNENIETKMFSRAGHNLKKTLNPRKYSDFDWPRAIPEYLDFMKEWLGKRL